MLTGLGPIGRPVFGSDVGDRLAEDPPVAGEILGHVLPFAVGELSGRLENPRAGRPRALMVGVDVLDAHHHTVRHRGRLRERTAIPVGAHDHNRRVADRK